MSGIGEAAGSLCAGQILILPFEYLRLDTGSQYGESRRYNLSDNAN